MSPELANKITVDKVDITRDMIKAYTKSHMLYDQHVEEEKKKKVLRETEVQASAISSDTVFFLTEVPTGKEYYADHE